MQPSFCLYNLLPRPRDIDLVQIRRIWFAGTSRRSLATCLKRPSLRLRTMYETSNSVLTDADRNYSCVVFMQCDFSRIHIATASTSWMQFLVEIRVCC